MSAGWRERLSSVGRAPAQVLQLFAPKDKTDERAEDATSAAPPAKTPTVPSVENAAADNSDTIWSDYLASVGRSPKRLFEGTKIWNSIKQVVRNNDRFYGPRPGEVAEEDDTTAVFLDEIMLFLQSQLLGPSEFLRQTGVTAEAVESHFAGDAVIATTPLPANREITIALPPSAEIEAETVCIENRTDRCRSGCRLVVNGKSWRDLDDIVRSLLADEIDPAKLTEEELAHALVFAFRSMLVHGPKNFDRENDPLARHPVALFNFFGESTCGVLALSFAAICAHAGLDVRVWRNACHTYPEVLIDGAWRIMDADPSAELHYPALHDTRQLMGTADLWGNEERAQKRIKMPAQWGADESGRNGRKRKRAAAFRSRERSRLVATGADILAEVRGQPPVETALNLRPGETVLLGYDKGGPWYCASIPVSLPPKRRSVMVREFDVLAAPDLSQFDAEGLALEDDSDGRSVITSTPAGGRLVVPLDHAYPIVDGAVEVVAAGPADEPVRLALRVGREATAVPPKALSEDDVLHFRLRRMLLRTSPPLPLALVLTVPPRTTISRIRVLLTCQIAGCSLPAFRPGDNTVRLEVADRVDEPSADATSVHMRLRYRAGRPRPSLTDLEPEHPGMHAVVSGALPMISWRHRGGAEAMPPGPYHVVVAHDPEMRYLVASNFEGVVNEPRLVLDDDDRSLLESGHVYYWRVRLAGSGRPQPDAWSPIFSFRVE